mmetsp:Transcript_15272/g.52196  ORF Transcript_15272/g.52196 Transcript_15272/m.52196 type:complete len:289 (+) Transcript_15272:786-1652(+)
MLRRDVHLVAALAGGGPEAVGWQGRLLAVLLRHARPDVLVLARARDLRGAFDVVVLEALLGAEGPGRRARILRAHLRAHRGLGVVRGRARRVEPEVGLRRVAGDEHLLLVLARGAAEAEVRGRYSAGAHLAPHRGRGAVGAGPGHAGGAAAGLLEPVGRAEGEQRRRLVLGAHLLADSRLEVVDGAGRVLAKPGLGVLRSHENLLHAAAVGAAEAVDRRGRLARLMLDADGGAPRNLLDLHLAHVAGLVSLRARGASPADPGADVRAVLAGRTVPPSDGRPPRSCARP